MDFADLQRRAKDAERELYNLGITFTVYSDRDAIDRILPFDVIPRVISAGEWAAVEAGVVQRVTALNMFLHDIYHDQKILKDGIIPADLVLGNANYRPEMMRHRRAVRHLCPYHAASTWCATDRAASWCWRTTRARRPASPTWSKTATDDARLPGPDREIGDPSGRRLRPALLDALSEVAPADDRTIRRSSCCRRASYNSAYFEHVFLAREMGVPLVEGRDLVVEDDRVYMKTTPAWRRST